MKVARGWDRVRIAAVVLGIVWGAQTLPAADYYWTGQGDGLSWHDPGNWSPNGVPGASDIVYVGYAADASNNPIDDVAQNIVVTNHVNINSLRLGPTGERTVHVSSENDALLTVAYYLSGVRMYDVATTNATLDIKIHFSNSSVPELYNYSDAVLTFGPNATLTYSGSYVQLQRGTFEMQGSLGARCLVMSGATLIAANDTSSFITRLDLRGTTLYVAKDSTISSRLHTYVSDTDVAIIHSGAEDRTLTVGYLDGASGLALRLVDPPDDSTGHLTLRVGYFNENSERVDTTANSTVELFDGNILASSNAGITGEGNFRLKRDSAGHVSVIRRAMTYTGRTMLDTGILSLRDDGALPTHTIVEIGANAGLRVNLERTVGGISDYEGTAGTLDLNEGSLTVHATQASAFGGQVTGIGALIKAGPETWSLTAGYTNAAGRTLRLEEGVLAVTGALSIEAGVFELAGGRATAGSLAATGTVWNVTLTKAGENLVFVNVATTADVSQAALNLALADGYQPVYGTKFTLLRAEEEILGAAPGGTLFGYEEGVVFTDNDQDYVLHWVDGSGNVVLTVIPEPSPAVLLVLALGLGGRLWRRRA